MSNQTTRRHAIAHGFSPIIFEASPYEPDKKTDNSAKVAVQPPVGRFPLYHYVAFNPSL